MAGLFNLSAWLAPYIPDYSEVCGSTVEYRRVPEHVRGRGTCVLARAHAQARTRARARARMRLHRDTHFAHAHTHAPLPQVGAYSKKLEACTYNGVAAYTHTRTRARTNTHTHTVRTLAGRCRAYSS